MRNHDGILGASNFPATAQLIYPDPNDDPEDHPEDNSGESTSRDRARPGVWDNGRSKVKNMLVAHADKEDLKSQVKFVRFHYII